MFSQYVRSCVFPRPNVSGIHVPGEEKRGKKNSIISLEFAVTKFVTIRPGVRHEASPFKNCPLHVTFRDGLRDKTSHDRDDP
ncbi:hypothetical protein PRIPAC_93598 [Pristionchus pacificus]|uniref:Uncharacterized protein n=1 Tax=Pristionchus pacificus TaxID=54126 RepID=A0A2A6BPT5_PRIPA|nr:hypothetical protein PRIPAC_93598 [Pristionchus pacificus]|eukprot:PDM67962.1 hypothetical protein PRIPAC_46006 [Pristionchus pacificus]